MEELKRILCKVPVSVKLHFIIYKKCDIMESNSIKRKIGEENKMSKKQDLESRLKIRTYGCELLQAR